MTLTLFCSFRVSSVDIYCTNTNTQDLWKKKGCFFSLCRQKAWKDSDFHIEQLSNFHWSVVLNLGWGHSILLSLCYFPILLFFFPLLLSHFSHPVDSWQSIDFCYEYTNYHLNGFQLLSSGVGSCVSNT